MILAHSCLQLISLLYLHQIKVAGTTSCFQCLCKIYFFAIQLSDGLKFLATTNIHCLIILFNLIAFGCCCGLQMPSESADG
jgi:hypothetical protein